MEQIPDNVVNYYFDLVNTIRNASIMYSVFHEPTVTDATYDEYKRQLHEQVKVYPGLLDLQQKARNIGAQLASNGKEARHDYPMLNMKRVTGIGELVSWFRSLPRGTRLDIESHVSGVSLELIYIGGKLHKAITRGDGMTGKDVTAQAYRIKGIPMEINSKDRVNIRGVVKNTCLVVDTEGNVSKLEGFDHKASVAEILNKAATENVFRDLKFIAHTADFHDPDLTSWRYVRIMLLVNCFKIPKCYCFDEKADIYELGHWEELLSTIDNNHLVFKVSDMQTRYDLGCTNRYPEWSVEYVG